MTRKPWVRSAPVSAADMLREHLWEHCFGAVVTSATLTALGRFDRMLTDLGLPADTPCFTLPSPFDHYHAAEFYVPPMDVEANEVEKHTEAVTEYLNTQVKPDAATLVLFSSWRQMRSVLASLDEKLNNRVLSQGEFSKNEILKRHREKIDKGEGSVIFGLASFTEGVDLPGNYLTEVIITKLPFSVPDDPVDATMAPGVAQRDGEQPQVRQSRRAHHDQGRPRRWRIQRMRARPRSRRAGGRPRADLRTVRAG